MRPKGRGRPQRILLGTWPEDHIRGVIRAVVFRDGGKEELPYAFTRVSHSHSHSVEFGILEIKMGLLETNVWIFGFLNCRIRVRMGWT